MSLELRLNNLIVPVDRLTFKGGEEQVKIDLVMHQKVTLVLLTSQQKSRHLRMLWLLLCWQMLARLDNIDIHAQYVLHLPYIPYARQDRVMQPGEALSIKVFANIVNSLGFDKVIVDDPHSDVSAALLNNVRIRHQHELAASYSDVLAGRDVTIIAPDAGARKKRRRFLNISVFRLLKQVRSVM